MCQAKPVILNAFDSLQYSKRVVTTEYILILEKVLLSVVSTVLTNAATNPIDPALHLMSALRGGAPSRACDATSLLCTGDYILFNTFTYVYPSEVESSRNSLLSACLSELLRLQPIRSCPRETFAQALLLTIHE